MSAYQSALQLFKELGGKREREIVNYLFVHKESSIEVIRDLAEGDDRFVNSLIAKNILHQSGEVIMLDERIYLFVEKFLEINEDIDNFEIDERIASIRQNIRLFKIEESFLEKERLINKFKRSINALGRVVKRNVIDLSRQVQRVYKTEINVDIKHHKILAHNQRASKLRLLIHEIEQMIDEEGFFENLRDLALRKIIIELKYDYLRVAKANLRELHQEIIDYLNKIEFLTNFYKKIHVVKKFKDQFELEAYSNVNDLFEDDKSLPFEPRLIMPALPSLDYLATDDGYDMILKVSEKVEHKRKSRSKATSAIDKDLLLNIKEKEQVINYGALKDKFQSGKNDLFTFLLNEKSTKELELSSIVKIFCKIALLYEDEMKFTGHNDVHENLKYAIIFPKPKSRKISK
ncbi:hypothetical protein [Aureibacter tunicatorum]|uniref:Uncharacterized protein n=1 Tax=Aureibacter tunicatorum TaxID=866807 RepID=A0AAE3XKE1_9BACT|nr:hypothetical protein [Aureibacter tunicatorum]MDR6239421.1 hypothetical protein [Aureibacter tunicatorum]BDD04656.1 hypothetical protein AUTU_21390 [Aureibacter tunicatorum]